MDIFEECISRQKRIDRVVREMGIDSIINKNSLIKERILNPAHYVVMLGETSSGKSTLINSLFRDKILKESVKPTTSVIIEVAIKNNVDEMRYVINKDSTYRKLEKDEFDELVVNPYDNIHRLRYIGECKDEKYDNLRLFDTPGYGSLESYHEEVLKSFIPESDFIIYTVSYKAGFGDYDYQFLKYVGEVVNKDVEIVLVVNMCSEEVTTENKRIAEIQENFKGCINREFETFLIKSSADKKPDAHELFDYIYERTNTESEKEELGKSLKGYQDFILQECSIKINSRIASIEAKKGDIEECLRLYKVLLDKRSGIIENIERGYTKIKISSIKYIDKSAMHIKDQISQLIHDEKHRSKKDELLGLLQEYYIPKFTTEQTENLINFIEDEIVTLEREIDNILKELLSSFEEKIKERMPSYSEVLNGIIDIHIDDDIKKLAGDMIRKHEKANNNAVSKNVNTYANFKKIGTPEQQNNKHLNRNFSNFFKVIRGTSIKAITQYLTVFTDSIFSLFTSINWQEDVENIAVKAVDSWANDLEYTIKKHSDILRDKKKDQIMVLYKELSNEFSDDENELKDLNTEELIRLKNEIEFLLNKCLLIPL